jgi:hypothetical protein
VEYVRKAVGVREVLRSAAPPSRSATSVECATTTCQPSRRDGTQTRVNRNVPLAACPPSVPTIARRTVTIATPSRSRWWVKSPECDPDTTASGSPCRDCTDDIANVRSRAPVIPASPRRRSSRHIRRIRETVRRAMPLYY